MSEVINQETLEKFHEKITQIPTFRKIPADFSKQPSVGIKDVFGESRALEQFKNVVLWLHDELSAGK